MSYPNFGRVHCENILSRVGINETNGNQTIIIYRDITPTSFITIHVNETN